MILSSFGRDFEEFEINQEISHWPGKTITESDNNLFCLLTMNHHPVHLDKVYCEGQKHGKILVVGTLTISLVVGMSVRDISGKAIANLAYQNITHDGPVFIGDTIHSKSIVLNKKLNKNGNNGVVKIKTLAFNQNDEIILTLERKILVPCRRK